MSEQLLTILKICLLVLLYLFFLRVLRAVWADLTRPKTVPAAAPAASRATAGPAPPASPRAQAQPSKRAAKVGKPGELTVVEPSSQKGRSFPLGDELTIGRAAGCSVTLDDTYVSQIHARVFTRDGQFFVEDLGSTNGTYLNRARVSGPMVIKAGDRLQVGSTVMEMG